MKAMMNDAIMNDAIMMVVCCDDEYDKKYLFFLSFCVRHVVSYIKEGKKTYLFSIFRNEKKS
jgi:hypothetical protein